MTETEWQACTDIVQLAEARNTAANERYLVSDRQLRFFLCSRCRRFWHLLSERARNVVGEAEDYADGATRLSAVKQQAATAGRKYDHPAIRLQHGPLYWLGGPMFLRYVLHQLLQRDLRDVNLATILRARGEEWGPEEDERDLNAFREVSGNPFRRYAINPTWRRKGLINSMASRMYRTGDFTALPILADALEDAGCCDEHILAHCRSGGEHWRGCWVLDLLMDKNARLVSRMIVD